jgi:choice-of-anchor B domain-containing protein
MVNVVFLDSGLTQVASFSSSLDTKLESQAAGTFLSLLGKLGVPGPTADIWGYANADKEYALVGYGIFTEPPNAGVVIVDVSNPATPVQVADINTVPGFDVKTWQNYMYTVNGRSNGFGGIVDISDPENPQVVGSMPSSHNIFIDDRGFMYLEFPGLRIFDLNPDPTNPELVWSDGSFGGHDASVIGNRLFDFHGTSGTNIYDVTDPGDPQLLGSITDPAIQFHHSGWPTEDGQFLFICDEGARHPTPDFTVWDISDVANPKKVGRFAEASAIIHNLYVVGNFAFTAYYTAGIRVFNISDPTNPVIVDEFDTSARFGEEFGGAFGVYPFAPSGNVYLSDEEKGLFVFAFNDPTTDVNTDFPEVPKQFTLLDNYPNPFNPATTISYKLPKTAQVNLVVYNALGQPIKTLLNSIQSAGTHRVVWDGQNDSGKQVSSGIYYYRIKTENFKATKRMLLLK